MIVRIVVKGSPSGGKRDNTDKAKSMLMKAFGSNSWPDDIAKFAITPGGFIRVPFPNNYDGKLGWESRHEDFAKIIPFAQQAIDKVLTKEILKKARSRAKFLTFGVDLNYGGRGKNTSEHSLSRPHAEVVAVVDTVSKKVVHWTGKSYPLNSQENKLVCVDDLKSHLFRNGKDRVLILGCHDLTIFNNRAYENAKGTRKKRAKKMRMLTKEFKPTIILQHPHSTDTHRTWAQPWKIASDSLADKHDKHIYASGIAYYNGEEGCRRKLADVLNGTRCCDKHVVDVKVAGI